MGNPTPSPAGRYTKRVWLKEPLAQTNDEGEQTVVYRRVRRVWAEVKTTAGRELVRNGQIDADLTYFIRIRFRSDITPDWRIEYAGNDIELSQALDVAEEHVELELVGTRIVRPS